jgi:protease-4
MPELYRAGGFDKIAIIPVKGVILDEQADFVRHCVDHVLNDSSYQAVVLRVNSPGGGMTASDQIWYQVKRLQDENIPVVASYGAVAASGGYYVSCHADHIICEETGVTGSIGVIAQIFTFQELANKVGIEPVTLVATDSPDKDVANNLFRDWNEQDRQKIRTMLDSAYTTFRKRVVNGRTGALADSAGLDTIADGSVFTAEQALELGLVDGLGYLDDAITKAEKLAKLRTGAATVQLLRRPPTLFPQPSMVRAATMNDSSSAPLLDADQVRNVINDLSSPRIMYLMR